VNGLKGVRREAGLGIAIIMTDLIRQGELLEEPENALGARFVEMMNCQHGRPKTFQEEPP
jgi:hypothetical protein